MQIEDFIIKFTSSNKYKNDILDRCNIFKDSLTRTYKEYELKSEIMKTIYKKRILNNVKPTNQKVNLRSIKL